MLLLCHFLANLAALGGGFPLPSLVLAVPAGAALGSLQGEVKITYLRITPAFSAGHAP